MDEETTRFIAQTLSEYGGKLDAMTSVLLAIVQTCATDPKLQAAIRTELERSYGRHLHESVNPHFLASFEHCKEFVEEALRLGQER